MTLSQLHPPHTDRIHCKRVAIVCWRTNEQKKIPRDLRRRKKKMNTTRALAPSEINYIDQLIRWQSGRHKLI